MKIKAAIFDMDGTILDSMGIWENLMGDYLVEKGYAPKDDLKAKVRDLCLFQSAELVKDEYGIDEDSSKIIDELNKKIENYYFYDVVAKDGAKEFLQMLEDKDIKMCVATATDRYLAEAALKRTGLFKFFKNIFVCADMGFGKERPDIYYKAAEFMGENVDDTIVFEDAAYAVKTAVKAGFTVFGIEDKYAQSQREEIKATAHFYISNYREMSEYID